MTVEIIVGDVREKLCDLADESVNCVVTSPPYFGLRDYGVDGQIGLEATPDAFIAEMVSVFREVRRVLRKDGTCWVNLGDSYVTTPPGNKSRPKDADGLYGRKQDLQIGQGEDREAIWACGASTGLPHKNLIGMPWRVALALQADGWILRQDIIWNKPNPMPESVQDRCTKAHEYIFLLSKSPRYHYDADAIAEPLSLASIARLAQDVEGQAGSDRVPGKTNGSMKAVGGRRAAGNKTNKGAIAYEQGDEKHRTKVGLVAFAEKERQKVEAGDLDGTRNARSVWSIAATPFKDAHFATFPPELAKRCIKAGCPVGGTVLDPFGGAGTTGLVAQQLGRKAILIELNAAYAQMARDRIDSASGYLVHKEAAPDGNMRRIYQQSMFEGIE